MGRGGAGHLLNSRRRHVDMAECFVERDIALQSSVVGEANEEHVDEDVIECWRLRDAQHGVRCGVACRCRREYEPLIEMLSQQVRFFVRVCDLDTLFNVCAGNRSLFDPQPPQGCMGGAWGG